MRLTLRTLLAWLDDTLSPSEVREIGRQVGDSPVARELVERIHRVTRQRRLTVPPWTGPEATDPNHVASYLDNELDPEQVAEFERKCLTSDVHLAEVASAHQILSLIGQKAKVPTDARLRMYQLVRGREAMRPKKANGAFEPPAPQPVAEPIPPWVPPPAPERPALERYGPAAAVVGLIAVLLWSAWRSLSVPEPARPPAGPVAGLTPGAPEFPKAEIPAPAVPEEPKPVEAPAPTPKPEEPAPKPEEAPKAEAPPAPAVPAGAAGLASKPSGLLLRYAPDRREWVRLTDATTLNEQDRLLNLEPYRSTVEVGQAKVDLVGETEVWVKSTAKTQAARLTLAHGRAVLHGTSPALPFEVEVGGKTVTLTPQPGATVGVERVKRRPAGEPAAAPAALRVYATEGPLSVTAGSAQETLDPGSAATIEADGRLTDRSTKPAPWVTEAGPSPFDQKVGEQFLQFFRDGRPLVPSLVEASEDESKDVCRLAINALQAVGDVSLVVPLLKKRGDAAAPAARRAAIAVLRSYLAEGPDAAKTLREQLQRDLGDELAATTEKLLVGYTAKEAGDEATYSRLVQLLGSTDDAEVGVRELALENLRELTGRDDLEYDPEKPEGKGLKAWRDLLRNRELKPPTPRPPAR